MKKVFHHTLVCGCDDCAAMFPADRFEPTWTLPQPSPDARRAEARLPLGHPRASLGFVVWVDAKGHLLQDWPGFPGTVGALVEMQWYRPDRGRVIGTRDPALAALADPVPLTRVLASKLNARCMVDFGLTPPDTADFVTCETHTGGVSASACHCVIASQAPERLDVYVFYDPDGDYPDVVCAACVDAFGAGDASVVATVCSRCQQGHLYRHRIVGRTHYGAEGLYA